MNLKLVNETPKSPYDIRDYVINSQAASEFPETFKCSVTVPVKNQGSKPTCAAHVLSSLVEYHNKRQTGTYTEFSTNFIYGYRPEGYYQGDGMVIRDALKTISKVGNVYYSNCKGNYDVAKAIDCVNKNLNTLKEQAYPHRISTYYRCNTTEEIKTALMTHGPVVVSITTHEGSRIKNDVYTYDPTKPGGRHCVLLYGWNEKGWLSQNSWGKLYAGDGRFIIPFDYKFNECWGITDTIIPNELKVKPRNGALDRIYKLINFCINAWLSFVNSCEQ